MKSLKELMNEKLWESSTNNNLDFSSIENFINSDKLSAKYITSLSDGLNFEMPDESSPIYTVAQSRARHSAISYLLGMIFEDFGDLMKKIELTFSEYTPKQQYALWMLTSLNHDRAYTSDRLNNPELVYSKAFSHALINEYSNDSNDRIMAYSAEEMLNYDRYIRAFHSKRKDVERIDHGILGGHILYNELLNRYIKTKKMTSFQKFQMRCCALTIAQHNIFKSSSPETDETYKQYSLERLMSYSMFRIDDNTPLLLLLCLVDTVECVKRFSKSETDGKYLQTLTVLENIKAKITKDRIVLDFSDLRSEIENKNNGPLLADYNKYLDSLKTFNTWTILNAEVKEDIVTITLTDAYSNDINVAS